MSRSDKAREGSMLKKAPSAKDKRLMLLTEMTEKRQGSR